MATGFLNAVGLYVKFFDSWLLARKFWLCALAFADEVDHLIYLFFLVVEVQRLHASLEVGCCKAFRPKSPGQPRVFVLYISWISLIGQSRVAPPRNPWSNLSWNSLSCKVYTVEAPWRDWNSRRRFCRDARILPHRRPPCTRGWRRSDAPRGAAPTRAELPPRSPPALPVRPTRTGLNLDASS